MLTTPIPCQLRERKQFVSIESLMTPRVRLTHIRPLTVSLCHPLSLEKRFWKLDYHYHKLKAIHKYKCYSRARNPTTISLGASGEEAAVWSHCLFRCYGTPSFIPGIELSRCRGHRPLQGEIRRSGRCKHQSISRREGRTKDQLTNKHHSLGKHWELFLGRWCLCLSTPVLIV